MPINTCMRLDQRYVLSSYPTRPVAKKWPHLNYLSSLPHRLHGSLESNAYTLGRSLAF